MLGEDASEFPGGVYEYDSFNRMTKAVSGDKISTYSYTADGRRRSKTVNGETTLHIWDGDNIVGDLNGDKTVKSRYYRGNSLIAQETGDQLSYYEFNGHGDVTGLTDAGGNIMDSYHYDAFGNQLEESVSSSPFRYNGQYTDDETGLIYLRNRYYNPATGRFMTEDPAKDGLNWYVYAGGNPVMFVDPMGLEQIVVSGGKYSESESSFKYNFIEPAIKKLRELKEASNGEQVTWLIANAGWTDTDRYNFEVVANDIGVRLAYFSSKESLFGYLNNKYPGEVRAYDRITKFAVFAHGFGDGTLSLGYNYTNNYNRKLDIRISDINTDNLKTYDAFDNPNSAFYSCNTGTDQNGWGSSFAQKWVNITGGNTWAFVGKTDYEKMPINESFGNKVARKMTGFSYFGSANYPSEAPGAYVVHFWKS